MTKLRNFLIFFILTASILCITVSACGPEFPFDPSEPYYEITPTAVHTILADMKFGIRHGWQYGYSAYLQHDYNRFKLIYTSPLSEDYRVNSHYKDQPSLIEQWDTYTEDYFKEYVLIKWTDMAYYLKETGDATPAPEIKHVYLQNNNFWLSYQQQTVEGEVLSDWDIGPTSIRDSASCEWHTFIEIKRADLEKLDIDLDKLFEDVHVYVIRPNPNTGDTSLRSLMLPLIAISLVSASVAWCGKKRKRA